MLTQCLGKQFYIKTLLIPYLKSKCSYMSYISFANFVTLIPMEEKNNLLLWVENPPFFFAKFRENRKK